MQLAKGLCFRYNDKFGSGYRCKSSSLSLLEIMEDNSLEGRDADGNVGGDTTAVDRPKINFHAILGNSVGATMKLKGEVLILADSGLIHNFIAETIVGELDFLVQTIPSFGVQIGNGDIIHCNKVC